MPKEIKSFQFRNRQYERKRPGNSTQLEYIKKKNLAEKTLYSLISTVSVLVIIIFIFAKGWWSSDSDNRAGSPSYRNQNQITVLQYFNKTSVRVGEIFKSKLILRNHSNKRLYVSGGDFSILPAGISLIEITSDTGYSNFGLAPGEEVAMYMKFMATSIGTLEPPLANVKLYQGEYLRPQNSIPDIIVSAVRLPGIDSLMTGPFQKTEDFYNFFAFKVIGIVLLICAIYRGFEYLINSDWVEYPLKRIGIAFLMAFTVAGFIPFVFQGILWFWKTTPPAITDFVMLLTVSTVVVIPFRFHLLSNILLDSMIPGFLLSLGSYLVYVGFKAYQHTRFMGFSLTGILAIGAVLGIAANAYILRKY